MSDIKDPINEVEDIVKEAEAKVVAKETEATEIVKEEVKVETKPVENKKVEVAKATDVKAAQEAAAEAKRIADEKAKEAEELARKKAAEEADAKHAAEVAAAKKAAEEAAMQKAKEEAKKAEKKAKAEAKKAQKLAAANALMDQCPKVYKPVSTSVYFWLGLIGVLPIIGLISSAIFSIIPRNRNIKNFNRALVAIHVIAIILVLILGIVLKNAVPEDQMDSIIDAIKKIASSFSIG